MPSTRRSFLGAAAALTATGHVFAQTPAPAATPQGSYAPATGIERDEFTVGMYSLPGNLDPNGGESNVAQATLLNAYDTLLRRDFRNNNALVGHLATAWQYLTDTELLFTLRSGVVFHDGSPMTADDVVYSFARVLTAADDSIWASVKSTYIQTIASVEAVDDLTIKITTHKPEPVLPKRLTVVPCFIVQRKFGEAGGPEAFYQTSMGTGAYRITSFTPDTEIVMERNDAWWGGVPAAKRLVFRMIPELSARLTALANGEIQIATSLSPDQVPTVQSLGTADVRKVPLANAHLVRYNEKWPGLEDKRLRRALNLAIDRDLLIETIFSGMAIHLREFQYPDFGDLLNENRPFTEFDLERARALVEESDYNGEIIYYQLVPGYYLNGDQTALAVVENWKAIGVNAEVQFNDSFKTGDELSAHTTSNTNLWGDPAGAMWRQFGEGSSHQRDYWSAPAAFNEIGQAATETLDVQERFDLYDRLTDIWVDEAPATDLYVIDSIYGVQSSVNWEPSPLHAIDCRPYNLSFSE